MTFEDMARSLNRVQLIGNLTRDPELRYTPNGTAVCSFGLATNRSWKTESGERRDEAEFHNIVSWNKLAEICSQFLVKGRKVYVEGRLATRSWTGQDGSQRNRTEIVISDMILLDSRRLEGEAGRGSSEAEEEKSVIAGAPKEEGKKPSLVSHFAEASRDKKASPDAKAMADKPDGKEAKKQAGEPTASNAAAVEEVVPDDIPF